MVSDMAVLEAIVDGQHRVDDLRVDLGKVRRALDNTDAVLGIADEGLVIAEDVVEEARKAMPVIIVATALITAAAIGVVIYRRRHADHHRGHIPEEL